ncbi:hypothetical protein HK096_007902, partial [Nowakowskiella sp. JEL0078]
MEPGSTFKDFVVCVRVRPLLENETAPENVSFSQTFNTMVVKEPRLNFRNQADSFKASTFKADYIINKVENSIVDLYLSQIKDMVKMASGGGTATVLAYGQTNSGKTYAISNICRFLANDILKPNLKVSLSAIEILGSHVTDLFTSSKVTVLEDILGKLQTNETTHAIDSPDSYLSLLDDVLANRRSSSTFKNNSSSRSHAILRLSFADPSQPGSETGTLSIVDLAGSERAASDSNHHTPEQRKESIEINKSLMALKECIVRRSQACTRTGVNYIPYRDSRLTLVLKEIFELTTCKPCRTVVIASVSPLDVDVSASVNTLRYATSLFYMPPRIIEKGDMKNPWNWSHEEVLKYLREACGTLIEDPALVCPTESGAQFCRIPENEFINRLITASNEKINYKRARAIYLSFWKEIVDAR